MHKSFIMWCNMFPLRYELDLYILFTRNSGLKRSQSRQTVKYGRESRGTRTSCNLAVSQSSKVWSSLLPYFDKPPVTDTELQTENAPHINLTVSCSYVTHRLQICLFRVHGDKHSVIELVLQLRNLGTGVSENPGSPVVRRNPHYS
jgi:hypothetical protein